MGLAYSVGGLNIKEKNKSEVNVVYGCWYVQDQSWLIVKNSECECELEYKTTTITTITTIILSAQNNILSAPLNILSAQNIKWYA